MDSTLTADKGALLLVTVGVDGDAAASFLLAGPAQLVAAASAVVGYAVRVAVRAAVRVAVRVAVCVAVRNAVSVAVRVAVRVVQWIAVLRVLQCVAAHLKSSHVMWK